MKGVEFQELELDILRNAIQNIEEKSKRMQISDPSIKKIISNVEDFLRKKKLICYGGTAINNILPYNKQFYDKSIELPDYDFFSTTPVEDAKELVDIYVKEGFNEVEAKSGIHFGTYKVFVNFIPVADITYLDPIIFKSLEKESKKIDGIYYAAPNFLRMAMFLELSRPKGDVSRWEKVLKRLTLLNKHYPLKTKDCDEVEIQRIFDDSKISKAEQDKIFYTVRDALLNNNVVFFGGFANRLYLKNLSEFKKKKFQKIPDFDVLSEEPERTATIVKERLNEEGFKRVKVVKKKGLGEIIAPHYEVVIGNDTVAFIYEPLACHSYNKIKMGNKMVKVATIDTMLSFYLAFIYANRPYYDAHRIICMSQYLFKVQQQNRLKQKGILRRFTMNCIGTQKTIEDIRKEKSDKYNELKGQRGTKEYEKYFLKYVPQEEIKNSKKERKNKTQKKKNGSKKKNNNNKKTVSKKKGLLERIESIF